MALEKKIAYIDLTSSIIKTSDIPLDMRRKFLGGRGLNAYLMYNHIEPQADPLGPENTIFVSSGLLAGTLASASARGDMSAKSPLTGFIGRANIGGFFAPEMRWAGFDHLVIKGKALKPVYLWVHDGILEIRDAAHLWGKDTRQTQELIRDDLRDQDVKVLTIGIAGEKMVRFANAISGPKNAGGRTGMGAVMGSKNLKAIAVRGTGDIKIAHPIEALAYNRRVISQVTSAKSSQEQGRLGTPFIWGATNSQGMVRVRNFQLNQLDLADEVEPENLERFSVGRTACFGCQVHCRGKYIIPEGPFQGAYNEGPEYTSLGAFASEPECRDPLTVLTCNHLVNLYGMDTLETGSMIAWAMELYEKGILTDRDTGGMELKFGSDKAVVEMVTRIARREGLGDILAEGPLRAAAAIGKDSAKYLIHVKGMSSLHSDDRPTPALALGIATSSRGADHLTSRPAIDLYHLPESLLRKIYGQPVSYQGPLSSDYASYEGKAWQVVWQEMCYMAVDCLGICKYHTTFLGPNFPNFEEWSRLLYLNTGLELSPLDIWNTADRAYTMERLFNIREGLTRDHDWLVDSFFDEPTQCGIPAVKGKSIDRAKFTTMLDEYYGFHGWDRLGMPLPETLHKLDIEREPSHQL